MAKNITMKDIAGELGVSTVTVSKALTDKDGVSDEVRQKIKDKAAEMGYRYNSLAKGMKEGRNGNIGIVVSDRFFEDNSFYNNLYRNIILKLNQTSYFGVFEIISQEQEEQCALPSMISNSKIDGLIIMGQIQLSYLEAIKKTNIPFILLDFYSDLNDINSITSDNIFGTYQLTNYLIEMGHTKIGYVGTIKATTSIMDRYLGYLKSLLQHDILVKNEWLINDRDERGRYIEIQLPAEMPTAFVCNCDEVAYNLVQHLKSVGLRVPEDISVVGFDDYLFATVCEPQLTTFKVNVPTMASIAVNSIIKRMKKGTASGNRNVVGGEVVIRDSVAKIT